MMDVYLPRRKFLHLGAGVAALPTLLQIAWAQAYPSRPITIIVPFGPGSASDTIARVIAQLLGPALKQSIVVETKPGANGTIEPIVRFGIKQDEYGGELALTPPEKLRGYSGGELVKMHGQIRTDLGAPGYKGTWYEVQGVQLWENYR